MEIISSLANPKIKNIVKLLSKSKERRLQESFIVEGARELSLAIRSGYVIDSVYRCADLHIDSEYISYIKSLDERLVSYISLPVFQKISYREGSDGIVAVLKTKPHALADLKLKQNPFVIVVEAIEKPGNLGAILRTADAAKVDAVIICEANTDFYNPNVIRSSVGCVFSVPVASATSEEAYTFLKSKNIIMHAAELNASSWYHETNFTQPSAIVMGTEANGLSEFWLSHADKRIKIPMRGLIDSLNVSVSTAILTFEAMRQRGF